MAKPHRPRQSYRQFSKHAGCCGLFRPWPPSPFSAAFANQELHVTLHFWILSSEEMCCTESGNTLVPEKEEAVRCATSGECHFEVKDFPKAASIVEEHTNRSKEITMRALPVLYLYICVTVVNGAVAQSFLMLFAAASPWIVCFAMVRYPEPPLKLRHCGAELGCT